MNQQTNTSEQAVKLLALLVCSPLPGRIFWHRLSSSWWLYHSVWESRLRQASRWPPV